MYKGEEQRQQQQAVTLQVTVSPETTEPSSYHQPLTLPIDIPGSYSHSAFDNEALFASYRSSLGFGHQASPLDDPFFSSSSCPGLTTEDLTAGFDSLAVKSPSQPTTSPAQVGSPISLYTTNVISGSHSSSRLYYSPSFVNSPASHSPAISSCYLSPQYPSPSLAGSPSNRNHQFLYPPQPQLSRSTSPVPDDVILTTAEVNDLTTGIPISDFFTSVLNTITTDDLELFPSVVQPASPTQPRSIGKRKGKLHQCPHCQHTSNRANNMKEHILIHDPNRPKSHLCKLCRRAFARKHDMNRHYISCKKKEKSTKVKPQFTF
ncbi:hypothetical protein A0J61_01717 [Choanephora cucurbitarum]|uniref:C2H2-type domain-containing protein n=1 Tax=Choanephora cucurbitarum TaxID=101091 RepID=A0A1C7NM89_9FUNG|nr:hypothetical protein A0J61_01717 [Choanephora cucurbitarum]